MLDTNLPLSACCSHLPNSIHYYNLYKMRQNFRPTVWVIVLLSACCVEAVHTTTDAPLDFAAVSQTVTNIFVRHFFPGSETQISGSQYVQVEAAVFDTDGDGLISVEEVRDNDPYTPYLGDSGAQVIFDYFDELPGHKDGVVPVGDAIYEFRFLDKNGDGKLTDAEFREQFPKILEGGARQVGLLPPIGK